MFNSYVSLPEGSYFNSLCLMVKNKMFIAYLPATQHGWNSSTVDFDDFRIKENTPSRSGIDQPAMFDYRRVNPSSLPLLALLVPPAVPT